VPSDPQFACPQVVLCDAPVFTRACATAGEAIFDGPPCVVGTEPRSWAGVKSLYD
jgi:hypothetical protein